MSLPHPERQQGAGTSERQRSECMRIGFRQQRRASPPPFWTQSAPPHPLQSAAQQTVPRSTLEPRSRFKAGTTAKSPDLHSAEACEAALSSCAMAIVQPATSGHHRCDTRKTIAQAQVLVGRYATALADQIRKNRWRAPTRRLKSPNSLITARCKIHQNHKPKRHHTAPSVGPRLVNSSACSSGVPI